jgi:hypothetical protein
MVDTETILVSVFIPILIGPLFIFFKGLWDRYNLRNVEIKKNYYNEHIKLVKDKLSLFYWPIYIKLCCLYHLNYNIIEDIDKEKPKIEPINLSETQSDTPNEEEIELRAKVKKKYKKKKCGYEYFDEEQKLITCENIVNHHDTSKYCFDCRKIILQNNKPMRQRRKNRKSRDHITINISDDLEWENSTSESERSTPFDEDALAILDLLRKTNSNSSMSDITGDGIGVIRELPTKKIIMDRILVDNLDSKIIELYVDIKEIIITNIAIGQPKSKLGRELTKFIRFVEMENIVHEANKRKRNQKFYESKDLGVVNNIKKMLEIIEVDLFVLQKEYNRMIKNYY